MFLKSEAAQQIKCTVYRSAKFLKFLVRFDQILYIFPQSPYRGSAPGPRWETSVPFGLSSPTRMLLPPPLFARQQQYHGSSELYMHYFKN